MPVKLRPFDIEGRNRFFQEHDYFNREAAFSQQVSRLHAAGQLGPEAKRIFEGMLSVAAVRWNVGWLWPR